MITVRFTLVVCLLSVACGGEPEEVAPPPITPTKDAIVKTTENGPVKATVTVWPPKPSLGDPIYARLEITAPAGITIEAPFQQAGDDKLGRFEVVGFTRDTRRTAAAETVHEQLYTLAAPSSGRHRIPPLRLEMLDTRASAPAMGSGSAATKAQEILTEEIPLEITPVATEAIGAELRPAAAELATTVGGMSWMLILGIVSGLAVLGSGGVLGYRAYIAKRRIENQRSAYEDAVAKLIKLEERGAPAEDQADLWFVELSAIVRVYLEERYDIRAPELTTEEFLQAVATRAELTSDHRGLLTGFLERCDRVKFAGYRPESAESLGSLTSARGFVEDTRLREVLA